MKALKTFIAIASAALVGISGCFWSPGAPSTTAPNGSASTVQVQANQLQGAQPLQGFVDFGQRQVQADVGDVANGATVSLIDISTGDTVATTLTSPAGVFSFSFGKFRPTSDVPYFLEAVKGLYSNHPSYDVVRLRTILVYHGGWLSITSAHAGGLVVISPETTALCIISAYRSAVVSASSLIGKVASGVADNSLDPATKSTFDPTGSPVTNQEFHTVSGLVAQAMAEDSDPFFRVRYNPAFETYSLSSEVLIGGGSGGGASPPPGGGGSGGPNAPQIQGLSSYVGGPGMSLTVFGINFGPNVADNTAALAGMAATVTAASPTKLTIVLPEGATSGLLSVTTSLGTSNGLIFTILESVVGTHEPLRAPTLTSVSPVAVLPGATVSIDGAWFDPSPGADWIVMNGRMASASMATNARLTFQVPAGWTSGNFQVIRGGAPSNALYLTIGLPLVVGSDVPSVVPGGTVRLRGLNFVPSPSGNTVNFVGGPGIVTAASADELTVIVPGNAQPGPVTVQTAAGTSANFALGILSGTAGTLQLQNPPTVTLMNPTRGPVGLGVSLTGTGFSTWLPGNVVRFNGAMATVLSASSGSLSVVVPAGATTGPVTVHTASGQAAAGTFTVYGPDVTSPSVSGLPQLTSLDPSIAIIGQTLTLTGGNFDPLFGNNQVSFNGVNATPVDGTSEMLRVVVPVGATSGNVTVTHSGGTSTPQTFYVIPANSGQLSLANPPSVTGVTPGNARVGTAVTITGTNFWPVLGANAIHFNGVSATLTAASSTSLTCTVPSTATTGPLMVSSPTGRTVWGTFTVDPEPPGAIVLPGAPTLALLGPNAALAGGTITLTGTNFHPAFNQNAVSFNGTAAVPTAGDTVTLTVTVPAGATSGNVTVTTSAGSSNALPFTVISNVGGTFNP